MSWYYIRDNQKVGPVEDAQFRALVASMQVTPETYVWRQGLAQWQRLRDLQASPAPVPAPTAGIADAGAGVIDGLTAVCAECGVTGDIIDMVRYKDMYVCAKCKPVFFQRVKEGAALPGAHSYGGFWIRAVAKIIDTIILQAGGMAFGFIVGAMMGSAPETPGLLPMLSFSILGFAMWGVSIAYSTWFVGKFSATPGKMACGLKVIRADGSPVSYGRAFGRYWAEIVSGMILYIGYIMAGFDDEKRALHDRICDTRVVKK